MSDARILLATPSAGYEQRVRQAFDERLNGSLRRCDAAAAGLTAALAGQAPDVVALGPGLDLTAALSLAEELEATRPEIGVLLVSDPTDDLWRHALRAGVRDVLSPDAADAEVRATFERALAVADGRRRNLLGDDDEQGGGQVIVVLSPKGGSGKTTVASNLAVALATTAPEQVAIVDLDLQFGDVESALRLAPDHTLTDAARVAGSGDRMALKAFLTPHPSGLWALCGPASPAAGDAISADDAGAVVRQLAAELDHVVVDTSAGISEATLGVLEHATDLVLVCAMDVSSVRSLGKELEALELLGMTQQRRHLVVNRADSRVGMDVHDIEAVVGMPVDVALPSTRLVPLSMNQGEPLVTDQPRSPIARQLQKLAGRFADAPVAGRGLLRRSRR